MKIHLEQIEHLIGEMRKARAEHPTAEIYYDFEDRGIKILYRVPKDIRNIENYEKPRVRGEATF